MRRRELIVSLGAVAAFPMMAHAQQSSAALIGSLGSGSVTGYEDMVAAFRSGPFTHLALTSLPIRSLTEWHIAVSVAARPSWQTMESNSMSLILGVSGFVAATNPTRIRDQHFVAGDRWAHCRGRSRRRRLAPLKHRRCDATQPAGSAARRWKSVSRSATLRRWATGRQNRRGCGFLTNIGVEKFRMTGANGQTAQETVLASLIVKTLNLEVAAPEIDPPGAALWRRGP
jgi:hypothetical protein